MTSPTSSAPCPSNLNRTGFGPATVPVFVRRLQAKELHEFARESDRFFARKIFARLEAGVVEAGEPRRLPTDDIVGAPWDEHFNLSEVIARVRKAVVARLSDSDSREQFILTGVQLFTLCADQPRRPTRDADFLSYGAPDPDELESVFNNICARHTEPLDALEWLPGKAAPIREDNLYGGVRIKLFAMLGRMRIPVQIDVGFGDDITPEPTASEWPMPLDFPPASLLVYCPETTIAEKLEVRDYDSRTTDQRLGFMSRNSSYLIFV